MSLLFGKSFVSNEEKHQNPKFLPPSNPDACQNLDFCLIGTPVAPKQSEDGMVVVAAEESTIEADLNHKPEPEEEGPRPKKAKSVRWAE